jgi:hypothetical protein
MAKLNSNIYGDDRTSMANAVSSDALDVETPGVNIADYWGETLDNTARSRSSSDKSLKLAEETPVAPTKNVGGGKDSRACTQGNHGKQGCDK